MKSYKSNKHNTSIASDPAAAYASLNAGLNTILEIDDHNRYQFITLIKEGLDSRVLFDFMRMADIHLDDIADILHVNSRTIRRSADDLLNIDLSEKVIALIQLYKVGHDVFGDVHIFNQWMRHQIAGLGYRVPLELIDTSIGIELVKEALHRIEHGIYS